MSKGITERTEDARRPWEGDVELAPSVLREDEPTVARTIAMIAASCVIFGGASLVFNVTGLSQRIDLGWGLLILVVGMVGLLAHAAFDRDLQVRRLYWGLGLGLLAAGAVLCIVPTRVGVGALFGLGYPCMGGGLLFLLAVRRHETDVALRQLTQRVIGGAGLVMATLTFLLGNNFKGVEFLLPYGALLGLMGLAYLAAFLSNEPADSEWGWRAGLLTGVLGGAGFLIGLLRSALPPLFHAIGWATNKPELYVVPWGLTLMVLGVLYVMLALGYLSDRPLVVLTRRELAAFFLSPMAYIVLVGLTLVGSLMYWRFLAQALAQNLPEPIVGDFTVSLWTVLLVTFIVPVLTMRLLSEEKRTGTLEVLLTAPVSESTVVVSKFIAALFLFLLVWVPLDLFLVGLRLGSGQPFDYRALYSFFVILAVTGAGFVSMGLFFSSLTRNQITSAVLTFAGMMGLFIIFFLKDRLAAGSAWSTVLTHMSYVDIWFSALEGVLVPKFLLFHLSMTVIWLFLAVKVLESRRWK